ncbi:MAG: tocopherol cyclase family protein [Anaerolineae bacterium]|nr:tocopherol cyclase family protein [Anaerolineae bacterium]
MIYFKNMMHPEGYHGHNKLSSFFEGWYFKLVDFSGKHRYAVIPGISLSQGDTGPHSFIQILDGTTGASDYRSFPVETFSAQSDTLYITIGENKFSAEGLALNLPGDNMTLRGDIQFSKLHPWPITLTSPGIMGWYAWVPFMECYHGVLSFDHILSGSLQINNHTVNFNNGRGYIEKDWGKSFPSGWIWMQSNHFATPGTSFTASIAMIPWIRYSFRGFIIGLLHNNHLYRFATYTGAKTVTLETSANKVSWTVVNRLHKLDIEARRAVAGNLRGPSRHDMTRRIPETLQAVISIKLSTLTGGQVLFEDSGIHGGLEIAGDQATLTGI